jgi:methane/ammonia monooxygenase subunit C
MKVLFVARLHWGFVFFGWMALGVFGAVLQLLLNVHRLLGKEGAASVALLTGAKLPSDRPKRFKQRINHSKVL